MKKDNHLDIYKHMVDYARDKKINDYQTRKPNLTKKTL